MFSQTPIGTGLCCLVPTRFVRTTGIGCGNFGNKGWKPVKRCSIRSGLSVSCWPELGPRFFNLFSAAIGRTRSGELVRRRRRKVTTVGICIDVNDVGRAAEFYRDGLGLRLIE